MNAAMLATPQFRTQQVVARAGDTLYDTSHLMQAATLGYLVGTGVPTDLAVQTVELLVARGMVTPTQANPLGFGLPWMVAGPAAGAPYYR